jgi:hypothetical protein
MRDPNRLPLTVQTSMDMHQAGVIACGANLRAGGCHGLHLVSKHGCGNIWIFDREGATKPTTLVGAGQLNIS